MSTYMCDLTFYMYIYIHIYLNNILLAPVEHIADYQPFSYMAYCI